MCQPDRAAKANHVREDLTEVSAAALDIIAACTSTQTSELNPVNSDHISPSSPEVESSKVRPLTIDFHYVSPSSPEAKSSNVCPLPSEEKT